MEEERKARKELKALFPRSDIDKLFAMSEQELRECWSACKEIYGADLARENVRGRKDIILAILRTRERALLYRQEK